MAICVLIGIAETKAQSGGAISAALSTRGDQTVLVAPDGAVWGLGRNINGSLGDGTTLFRSGLVRMQSASGNLTGAVDVACGTNHTAVLLGNGTVWTVGLNSSGELGNGNTTSQRKAVQVLTASGPLTGVTALAAGASHTLALGPSGEVWAWGYNAAGQLGNNSTVNSTRATKVLGLTGIVAIAAGDRFSYAVKNDGTAWAFGDNANGQLGNNSTTASRIPVQVRTSSGNLSGVKATAGGKGHGVFLTATGGVWSVGLNSSGQLGNNSTTNGLLAVPSRGLSGNLSGIAEVACGDAFTLFLSANGTISAVGSNTNGQLGDGTRVNRLTAVPVAGLTSVSFVCAGADRSFGVKSDGGVFAWGGDLFGAQGQGARGFEWSWSPLPQWSAFARAAAGSSHTLWLKADGSVWAAGRNLYGQLGNGLASDSLVPVQTQSGTGNLTAIQDVAAGTAHSLALAQNGAVWAWGLNSSGRLGDGTGTSRTKAVPALDAVGPISGTSAVAAGDAFSLALRQSSVWAWGVNNLSQLGDGTTTSRSKAVPVLTTSGALTGITALAAGANHGVALKGDGTVWVWGYNNQGQLGLGNTLTQNRAVSIPGVNDALAIAAGSAQTYILRSIGGGTAWGAGQNNVGQLADGTTTARSSLVQVQSTTGALTGLAWVRSGALAHHAAAGRMDGTSWIWGHNDAGQLATGNFTSALKALALPPGIRPQAIGATFTLARRADYEWVASGSFFDAQWGDGRKAYYVTPTLVRGVTFAQTPPDTDGDGVPDWQEIVRGSSATTADTDGDGLSDASDTMPLDYFNGYAPALAITSGGNQTGVPGSRLAQPLVVSVSRNGTALANAPVVFSVTAGGLVADGNGTLLLGQLPVRTNAAGQAIAYYTLPSSEGSVAISVQAGNATASLSATATWIPAAPVLSISGGTFTTQRRVVATSATPDARIHYTLEGTDPTSASPSIASGESILVDRTATLKTRAIRTSGHVSPVVSGDFKITGMVCAVRGATRILKSDGTVWGWGQNWFNQLGDGSPGRAKKMPVQARGLSGIVSMATGSYHTLALDENGRVWACGYNEYGQLGDGTRLERKTPVKLSTISDVKALATGSYHSLALTQDGSVYAWGSNWNGQLGDGTTTDRRSPTRVAGLANVVAIACGEYHSLALTQSGAVYAWGYNEGGQLGDGTLVNRPTPTLIGSLSGIQAISAGCYHTQAMSTNGTVYAWGQNTSGQLGDGSNQNRLLPVPVAGLSGVATLQAGAYSSFAIQSDGKVRAWGANWYGQLGDLAARDRWSPVILSLEKPVMGIGSSSSHTAVLFADGTLGTWGSQESYALGDQRLEGWSTALLQLKGLSGIASISSRSNVTAALAQDGRVLMWGENSGGQLGDGTTQNRRQLDPVAVQGLPAICEVFAIQASVLARGADGSLWTWGGGYLGLGNTTQSSVPVRLPNLPEITALPSSFEFSSHRLVVDKDSKIWAWGANWNGQLGDNSTLDRTTPAQVPGIDSIQTVALGRSHSLALKKDGTVWAWGYGQDGQLGDPGIPQRSLIPTRVAGLSDVVAISAGDAHSMALTANGSVFVWGTTEYATHSEDGDYPINLKSVPTRRAELPPIVSISSSGHTIYAMDAAGTVWTWGGYAEPSTDGYWPWNLHREVPVRMDRIGKALANSGSLFLKQDGMLYTTEAFPAHCQQIRLIPPPIRLVPAAADANNNAVPDAWELAQFGNTTTPMWEDSDGDGLIHIEEYHLGTNPKNANTDGDLFTDLADPRPLTADPDAAPTATLVAGNNQRILPGTMAPQPLEILLTLGGQPMANTPVIARITGGTGKLAATANATVLSDHALLVRTDAQGKARVHLQAPATEGTIAVTFDALPTPITFQATAEIPIVTLAVTPTSVTEDGAENLVYTFTRNGATSTPLTVNFTVGGNATFGTDYTTTGALSFNATTGSVAFAANATTATVAIDPTGDPASEPNETMVLTLTPGGNYTVGTPEALTGTILNDDTPPPAITSALSANATVGTDFTYQIAASNNATSYSASGLPVELTLNATSGLISGTPTVVGNSTITLGATNAGGTGNATLALQVFPPAPAITIALSINATVGVPFTYQIAASNNATSYSAIGLPIGLTLNATSGLISGTPTAIGNSTVTLSATNAGGTGNATLLLRVRPAPPVITSALSANATAGAAFTYQIAASNNPTSYTASGLPAGLTLNATSGLISGTRISIGNSTITLGATNAGGTGSATLALRFLPPAPAIMSAVSANATVGVSFTYQIVASNNPTSYTVSGLPAGLTLNATSGLISGTPTAIGNSTVTLSATNAGGTGNATLALRVVLPAPPAITSALTANATLGTAFSYQIKASNNAKSYSASGLAAGLALNATSGLIDGTPTAIGNSTITLAATNAGGTGSATLALQVLPPPPAITSARSANVTVGTAFNYQITTNYKATSYIVYSLPVGLTLNATSGLISGTPTAIGNSTITLGAKIGEGMVFAGLAIRILPQRPTITSALTANAKVGAAFSYQITASNNATSYSAGGLPGGLTLNATSGLISGTPKAEGAFTVGLTAANSGGSSSVVNLALTITHSRIISLSGNLSFGNVGVNQTVTRTLTISNTGTGNLTVTGITYPAGFSGNLSENLTVAPNGFNSNRSQNLTVTFTPTDSGYYIDDLTVLSNASSGNATIAVEGTGVPISLPSSFTTGLRLWLRADQGVSKDAAGKVSGWADQSRYGNAASQSSANKQPLFVSSAVNGRPGLRFDGVDDFFTLGASPSLVTPDLTIFVVASFKSRFTSPMLSRAVGPGPNNKWIFSYDGSGLKFVVSNNTSTGQSLESRYYWPRDQAEILSLTKTNREYQFFRSGTRYGVQKASLDVPAIDSDFRIGQAEDKFYLHGDMAEVVIYDRVLSVEERQAVENYLALKYALPIIQDADGDDMPDEWEVANGLNPLADDTLEDLDGDRVPNIFEFQRGFVANDPASKPAATFVVNPATGGASTTDNVYATIQAAVGKAQEQVWNSLKGQYEWPNAYAVIEVKSGSYAEKVTLNDVPMVLLGELGAQAGPPSILGNTVSDGWSDNSLEIHTASVVDGFVIGKVPGRTGRGVYVSRGYDGGKFEANHPRSLVNCLIRGNESGHGAGVFNENANLSIVHCTVFGNKGDLPRQQSVFDAPGRGISNGSGTLNLINSIVWGNTGTAGQEIWNHWLGTINASSSIVVGGEHGGLNIDPQLTPAGWLKSTSPAINRAGTVVVSRVDIHGVARPVGATSDLGTDEYKDANGTADGDGLPDWAEGVYGNASLDPDRDGLNNLLEYQNGTDPNVFDTDGDKLPDGWEVANGLNPKAAADADLDTDADGYTNAEEYQFGKNPRFKEDTDGDGMPDGWEYHNGLNPVVNDAALDPDRDGLSNLLEYQAGTKANVFDTDLDGLPDGFEYRYRSRLRPTVWDDKNLDPDGDGITDKWEAFYGFDPTVADGGADPDGDGLSSAEEIAGGSSPVDADIDGDGLNDKQEREQGTSPWRGDTDRDSLSDGWEVANGFNPNQWNDPASDGDNDGLSDWWEARQATNPRVADTDGDGTNDGTEVANNTDPSDPEWGGSPPAAPSDIRETVNGDGSITYTWKDNSNNEEGFRIWRKTESGTWQQVGSVPANATSLTIPAP